MKYFEPLKLYQEFLKLKTPCPLMGLHIGDMFVGSSLSNNGVKARIGESYPLLSGKDFCHTATKHQSVISTNSVSGLVIGYPYVERRKTKFRQRSIQDFVDALTQTGKFEDVKYTFADESYTQKVLREAINFKKGMFQTPPLFPASQTEEYAAFEILEEYLMVAKHTHDQINQNGAGEP